MTSGIETVEHSAEHCCSFFHDERFHVIRTNVCGSEKTQYSIKFGAICQGSDIEIKVIESGRQTGDGRETWIVQRDLPIG